MEEGVEENGQGLYILATEATLNELKTACNMLKVFKQSAVFVVHNDENRFSKIMEEASIAKLITVRLACSCVGVGENPPCVSCSICCTK